MNPMPPDAMSLALQQKLNELMSRSSWQRTVDIGVDRIERGIVPKATSLKTDWFKFEVERPSVFQLMNAGVDQPHLVYLTQTSPDDLMVTEGRARPNQAGRGFCLQVGTWYVYVPLVTGDPATFTARVSDASSDLPAQQNAIDQSQPTAPGGAAVAAFDSGNVNESALGQYVRAALTGQDLQAAAGTKNRPISSDLASVFNGSRAMASIQGLYVNAICGGIATGSVAVPVQMVTALTAIAYSSARMGVDSVVRGDDGATYSVVAVRGQTTDQSVALNRLLTDSLARGYDPIGPGFTAIESSKELSGQDGGSLNVTEARARGYWSSRRGRRYVYVPPATVIGFASLTTFTTTAPQLILVNGATKAIVIKRLTITQDAASTNTLNRCIVKTDTANRYTSGGTSGQISTMNAGNAVATNVATFKDNSGGAIVATAEGGGTRQVGQQNFGVGAGARVEFLWEDGLIIPASGSLLVYLQSLIAAANFSYEIEVEEAQVQ